jgi:hypothetical protein
MDPAALGTLIIGLEANRFEESHPRPRRGTRRTATASPRPVLGVIAGWLRQAADRLDRPVAGVARG